MLEALALPASLLPRGSQAGASDSRSTSENVKEQPFDDVWREREPPWYVAKLAICSLIVVAQFSCFLLLIFHARTHAKDLTRAPSSSKVSFPWHSSAFQ